MKQFPLICAAAVLSLAACQKNQSYSDTTNDTAGNAAAENTSAANMSANTASASSIDSQFVTDAIKGDNGEVRIGQMAQSQASSQAAKDFGKMLETDHGAHKAKLAAMASAAGIAVPDGPSDDGQKNIDKLKPLSGTAFDKAFKEAMIEDHNKDIAKYEKQASGTDSQTAAMAKDTLPVLKKHLATAKAL